MGQRRDSAIAAAISEGLELAPSRKPSGYLHVKWHARKQTKGQFYVGIDATPSRPSYTDGPYETPEEASLSAMRRLATTSGPWLPIDEKHSRGIEARRLADAAALDETEREDLLLEHADTSTGYRDVTEKPHRGTGRGFSRFEARITLAASPGCPSGRENVGRFDTALLAAVARAKRVRELEAAGSVIAHQRTAPLVL